MKILLSFFYFLVLLIVIFFSTINIESYKNKRKKKKEARTLKVVLAGPLGTYGGPDPYYNSKIKLVDEYTDPDKCTVHTYNRNIYIVKNNGLASIGLPHDSVVYCRNAKFRENLSGNFVIAEPMDKEKNKLDPFSNITFEKQPNLIRKAVAQVSGIYESDDRAINRLSESLFTYIKKYAKEHPGYVIDEKNIKKTFTDTIHTYPKESVFILTLYIQEYTNDVLENETIPVFEVFPLANIKEIVEYANYAFD